MVYRGITVSILTGVLVLAGVFAAPALLGGCGAAGSTFAFNEETTTDPAFDQIVSLQVFPVRREYALKGDAIAKTEMHLRVFAVYANGNTRQTPLQNTDVILEDPDESVLLEEKPHPFASAGEKLVTVNYGARSALYSIMVRSEDVPGVPGSSSGGGISIIIDL
jgi:hypothetical protein